MAKEIERRFLVETTIPWDLGEQTLIKQGYILASKDKQVRIRVIDHTAFLCVKFTRDFVRDEFEYQIPLADGLSIFTKCKLKIEKIRNSLSAISADYHLDVDTYPNGLVIAEVEFKSEEASENFIPVDWFGKEITGQFEYSNIALAKGGLHF
jgi:adenylate cyclase